MKKNKKTVLQLCSIKVLILLVEQQLLHRSNRKTLIVFLGLDRTNLACFGVCLYWVIMELFGDFQNLLDLGICGQGVITFVILAIVISAKESIANASVTE